MTENHNVVKFIRSEQRFHLFFKKFTKFEDKHYFNTLDGKGNKISWFSFNHFNIIRKFM
jgi:hypothetical protein